MSDATEIWQKEVLMNQGIVRLTRESISFRADPALRSAIEAAASRDGIAVSKWVVNAVRKALASGMQNEDEQRSLHK